MSANLPYTAIRSLIIIRPTLSEGLVTLLSAVPPLRQAGLRPPAIERTERFPQKYFKNVAVF